MLYRGQRHRGGAAAFELLDRGWTVTIVEQGEWDSGASGAAVGMLCLGAEILTATAVRRVRFLP